MKSLKKALAAGAVSLAYFFGLASGGNASAEVNTTPEPTPVVLSQGMNYKILQQNQTLNSIDGNENIAGSQYLRHYSHYSHTSHSSHYSHYSHYSSRY